jgi:hypothetical protein
MDNDPPISHIVRARCANHPLLIPVFRLTMAIARAKSADLRVNMDNGLDNLEDVRVNSHDGRLIMHVVQFSCTDLPVRIAVLRQSTSIAVDIITDVQLNSENDRLSLPAQHGRILSGMNPTL